MIVAFSMAGMTSSSAPYGQAGEVKSLYISVAYGLACGMTLASYEELTRKAATWQMQRLQLGDGAQLRYGIWPAQSEPQGFVLLIPGRGEFIEKYTEVADEWAQRGFSSVCFDLRGQGGSTRALPEKSHIDSFDTYLRDLGEFWQKVWVSLAGDGLAIVQGHSTGAHLALRHLATPQPAADALIVTAPIFDISTARMPAKLPLFVIHNVISIMGRLCPTAYAKGEKNRKPEFTGNPYTHDERRFGEWVRQQQDNPALAVKGVTYGWVRAALLARPKLDAALPHMRIPLLAFITPNDGVVDGQAQRQLKATRVVECPDDGHELLRAPDATRAMLWAEKDAFLQSIQAHLPETRCKKPATPRL